MWFLLSLANASTWSVATDGSGQFLDLQSAIDAAQDGDVIEVGAGTWVGGLRISARNLIIRSKEGADATVLDGGDAKHYCGFVTVAFSWKALR